MSPNDNLARDLEALQRAFANGQFQGIQVSFPWRLVDYYVGSASRRPPIGDWLVAATVIKAYVDLRDYPDQVKSLSPAIRSLYKLLDTKNYTTEWHILLLLWTGHLHKATKERDRAHTLYAEARRLASGLNEGSAKDKTLVMCELFLAWNHMHPRQYFVTEPQLRLAARNMGYDLQDLTIRSAHQLANVFLALIARYEGKKWSVLMYARAAGRMRWTLRGPVHDLKSDQEETRIIFPFIEPFSS